MSATRPACWQILLAVIALTLVFGAVFFPILGFEFVDYDVPMMVINNPHIRGLSGENLRSILTSRSITSYYPVRTLTYAIDYQLWGLNPRGFKLTGGLMHLGNALLVFWLVLRLLGRRLAAEGSSKPSWDVAAATFSAGLFAIHPVVVEPVTWLPGREELLMTLGALGCLHLHLTARRLGQQGGRAGRAVACYVGAAFCCALACFSNAVAAVIPLLVVAWDVLTLKPPKLWKIVYGTAALWAISITTIVIKQVGPADVPLTGDAGPYSAVIQRLGYPKGTLVGEVGQLSPERLMLIPNVYWLNLKTLVWPTRLCVAYDWLEPQSFLDAEVLLGTLAFGLTCLLLWVLRRRRLALFGLLWFGLALAPASQIMPHHVHRADRFLYLPLIGLAIAAAMGLRHLLDVLRGRIAAVVIAAVGVLTLLGVVSAGQVQTWQNSLSMWEACVRAEPDNARAHMYLSDVLATRGQLRRAAEHYAIAMRLEPSILECVNEVVLEMATCQPEELRDYDRALRLATQACQVTEWREPKHLRALAVVRGNLAKSLADQRQLDRAVENYQIAIQLAGAAGDAELVGKLQRGLKVCQAQAPRPRAPERGGTQTVPPNSLQPGQGARQHPR